VLLLTLVNDVEASEVHAVSKHDIDEFVHRHVFAEQHIDVVNLKQTGRAKAKAENNERHRRKGIEQRKRMSNEHAARIQQIHYVMEK
jgi:hypothetical protein